MTSTSSPDRRRGAAPRPSAQRVLARVRIEDTGYGTPCWLFQGALTGQGYGNVGSRVDGESTYEMAHRAVFTATFGPIEDGLHLDHLCNNRACVSPGHLEPVTVKVNNRRQRRRRDQSC